MDDEFEENPVQLTEAEKEKFRLYASFEYRKALARVTREQEEWAADGRAKPRFRRSNGRNALME